MSNVSNAFGAVVCKEGKRLKGGSHSQKLGLQNWTVKEIVSGMSQDAFSPYGNNRGRGKVVASHYKNIAKNLNLDAIGEITLSLDSNGNLRLVDGHNRLVGLALRYKKGNMTIRELNQSVGVKIIKPENFMKTYSDKNNQA